jgi:hypothetical protein
MSADFRWVTGRISNPTASTLLDPNDYEVAHVYRGRDRLWYAVTAAGDVLAENEGSARTARAAVDAEVRPAA